MRPPFYSRTYLSACVPIRSSYFRPTRLYAHPSIQPHRLSTHPYILLTLHPLGCVCTNPTIRQPISLPTRLSAYNLFLQRSTFQHFYPPNRLSTNASIHASFYPPTIYPPTCISAHTSIHLRFYPPTPLLSRLTVYRPTRLSAYASFTPSIRLPVHSPTRVSAYASIRPPV